MTDTLHSTTATSPTAPKDSPPAVVEDRQPTVVTDGIEYPDKPEGPISAAILAGGIGCLAVGVLTTAAEASTSIKDKLNWSNPVGPLSGKSTLAVVVWLVSWAVLYAVYRKRELETTRAFGISMVLVGVGVLLTFPTFFQLFGA